MAITLNATTSSGLVITPDNSGNVLLQYNGQAAPAFSAYRNSNQSISSGVITKVQLNTELFDTNNNFDSTTNYRFTPTVAGYYQINAQVRLRGTSSDNKILYIYKNGSNYAAMDNYAISIEYFQIAFSQVIYFNGTTDYIEMYALTNGTNTTIVADATVLYTSLSGSLMRGA